MYCVYWIKRKEHKDFTCEGYVGISNNLERRLAQHKKSSNKKVRYAVNSDNFDVKVLFDDLTEEEAKRKEFELRPEENIGWNFAKGGNTPPKSKKGHKKTEPYPGYFRENWEKNLKSFTEKWNGSAEQKEHLSKIYKNRKITWGDKISAAAKANPFPAGNPMAKQEYRDKVSKAKTGTKSLYKDGSRKLAHPGSEKWNSLIASGWVAKASKC